MAFQTDTLTVPGLKKLTKDLRRSLREVNGTVVPLNQAQEIVARQLGYSNWHVAHQTAQNTRAPGSIPLVGPPDPRDPYLLSKSRRWRFDEIDDKALRERFKGVSDDTLQKRAFHVLPTVKLLAYGDPLVCWIEQDKAVTVGDIQKCLADGEEALVATPLWTEIMYQKTISAEENLKRHIQKVAYFIRHPALEPISIDVGVPELGCYMQWLVDDGNHRLAGAGIRGDRFMAVKVGGSVKEAQARGLWNPTPEEQELSRRQLTAWYAQQKEKPKARRRRTMGS